MTTKWSRTDICAHQDTNKHSSIDIEKKEKSEHENKKEHAKREDNDRFRSYSCMYVYIDQSLAREKKRKETKNVGDETNEEKKKKKDREYVQYARR